MWLFLFIILIGVGFYVLGAKNGLPKISLIPKSQREKRRYEERIDFLSVLKKGDNIKIYEIDDENCFRHNYKRTYDVVENYRDLELLSVKRYSYDSPTDIPYDSKHLKDIIEDNMNLVARKIKESNGYK